MGRRRPADELRGPAIFRLVVEEGSWIGGTLIDFDEEVRQPFDVFRRADLGARPLAP